MQTQLQGYDRTIGIYSAGNVAFDPMKIRQKIQCFI